MSLRRSGIEGQNCFHSSRAIGLPVCGQVVWILQCTPTDTTTYGYAHPCLPLRHQIFIYLAACYSAFIGVERSGTPYKVRTSKFVMRKFWYLDHISNNGTIRTDSDKSQAAAGSRNMWLVPALYGQLRDTVTYGHAANDALILLN